MRKIGLLTAFAMLAFAGAVAPSFAQAPNNAAYVDPKGGTDSGTCGAQTNQCLTLNQALANLSSGGIVYIQSGGLFPPIYLTQNVSIVGPEDGSASILWSATAPGCVGGAPGSCGLATANYAVEIAGTSSTTVKLSHLGINNGTGTNGAMKIGNAFNVRMNGLVLRGGSGTIPQILLVAPGTGSNFQLIIAGGDIGYSSSGGGILMQPTGATPVAFSMHNSEVNNVKFGVKLDATLATAGTISNAAIDATHFSSFTGAAFTALATAGGASHTLMSRSTILNAGAGAVNANGANAVTLLYQNVITGNLTGVNIANGATVFTFGNNDIFGNGTNVAGTLTATPQQ
jgi:hypothetical protein